MKILQNTPNWHELRKTKIGASDAPIIMGVSKWRSPYALWKEKSNLGESQADNSAMRRGREMEPIILDHACKQLEMLFTPQVCLSKHHSWMMASLDGLSHCGKIGLEIKCAGRTDHQIAMDNQVPEHYWPQLQHQLVCAELDEVIYYSFNDGDARVVRVQRDEEYIAKLLDAEQDFWRRIEDFDPPNLVSKDYIDRNDDEWIGVAKEFLETKEIVARHKALGEKLKSMANGKPSCGGGVKVYPSHQPGRVDYKAISELNGVDLARYRKPSYVQWTVR